ncbi:hypothetical protein Tco_0383920, partial [Tanacetum coccineum]
SDGTSWGIPLMDVDKLLKMDPYEEVSKQGQAAPPSPAYVPDPIELENHIPVLYIGDALPVAQSLGYVADSDLEEDPEKDPEEDPGEDPEEDPNEDHANYPNNRGAGDST